MDTHTLMQQFCHIVSLASLAYIFSAIHAIQYSLLESDYDTMDPNGEDLTHHTLQETAASTSYLDFTSSTPNTSNPADTSSSSGKVSSCWTDQEITLLLNYVEVHCSLNTSRGLNLKKSQFNKARDMVKSKDALQSHYKWGHVCILVYINLVI